MPLKIMRLLIASAIVIGFVLTGCKQERNFDEAQPNNRVLQFGANVEPQKF